MGRIEIGCLCRDQIKSDAHEHAQELPRLENLEATVGKLFSQLCSFLFVEESLIHGKSSCGLPTFAGRVTAAYFLAAMKLLQPHNSCLCLISPSSSLILVPAHTSCLCSNRRWPHPQYSLGHKCSGSKTSPKYIGTDSHPHSEHFQRTPSPDESACLCRCAMRHSTAEGLLASDVRVSPILPSAESNPLQNSGQARSRKSY